MNIGDAVRVLNEFTFASRQWEARHDPPAAIAETWADGRAIEDFDRVLAFDGIVAIAIAEKLERDAGRDMPATRRLMDVIKACRKGAAGANCDMTAMRFGKASITYGGIDAAIAEWEARS